jgi:CPA1 family monovalent cation:H+ antiporter
LTVAAVAMVARWLEPSLPLAAAVALGAIVAPPDAAAATAVLRQVRLPHRLTVILEGESLLNDASALLIYRVAVGAMVGGVSLWTAPVLALAAAAGMALGVVLAKACLFVIRRVSQDAPANVLGFLAVFGVWLLADALGLSAVLTMVAFAVTLAQSAPERVRPRRRRANYAVWEVAVFVLNVLAFILVGLQLRGIMGRLDGLAARYAGFALAVLATTILVRMAWVLTYYATARRWKRPFGTRPRRVSAPPTVKGALVVGWCGMRGIVTLAAALALPAEFPQRDLIVFAAFCVVLGTLVVQGLTLRPLLSRLAFPLDESVREEAALARAETARAALQALDAIEGDADVRRLLERRYRARLETCGRPGACAADPTGLGDLRRVTLRAERIRLAALRREAQIGDDAFHVIEEELDWAEVESDGSAA